MSEGETLAKSLWDELTDSEKAWLQNQDISTTEGFLIGRFGKEHSRVALYNAAQSVYLFRA